jgi:CheY-like chemotaxis protein
VEDNVELLAFMARSLAGNFRILTAHTGREGLDLAQQELPDVIVSDVMMPEMDGYQLTNHIKQDPATDHIALVLLTARAAAQSRREGLSAGADDYLTKPFDLDELRLRLSNIVTRQQKLRDYYQRQLEGPISTAAAKLPKQVEKATRQEAFLIRLHTIIEAHLDDSTFRAESLAREVAMSVRTLTRKLSSLAGISPARLIRTYRMRRATEFLQAGHPVAETAYLVGFEHPANFATAFKEVYQQTPTEFLSSNLYQ